MFLVSLRRLSLSTGFLNLDDLRKSPFGEDGSRPPSGEDGRGSRPPSGADGSVEAPFAIEGSRPLGRFMVRGDRKDAVGPLLEGGR
jgi:hypothetical protein